MSDKSLIERIERLEKVVRKQEKHIASLEKNLVRIEDIEAIKRLQKAYGYYVEHWMYQEIIDCFSDGPGVYLNWIEGVWKGRSGTQ